MPTRICPGCNRPFQPKRKNQKHHNGACRVAAHRKRVDPQRGSDERKQAQLDGLERSGKSGLKKAIIRDLARRELLPPEDAAPSADQEQDPGVYATHRWRKGLRAKKPSGKSAPPSRSLGPWDDPTIGHVSTPEWWREHMSARRLYGPVLVELVKLARSRTEPAEVSVNGARLVIHQDAATQTAYITASVGGSVTITSTPSAADSMAA